MNVNAHMIVPRKELINVEVYKPGKPVEEVRRELGLSRIIKLASNENPLGCSVRARAAMLLEAESIALYPEATAPKLVEKLTDVLGVHNDQIIIGNGSDGILHLLTRSYIRPGDEVIMADVTFARYEANVILDGGVPVHVPLIDGVHDLNGMITAITNKTRMIFVCNPNNPTGTIVAKRDLLGFIKKVPSHILLVIDEAYFEYVTAEDHLDCIPLVKAHPNLIVLRTFSKAHGLAALRIGYGIMDPAIIQELLKVKEPFNTNRLGQAAATASLEDLNFINHSKLVNAAGRRYIEEEVAKLGLRCFPSQANFLMIQLELSGDEVFQSLLQLGIIVRPGSMLGYPNTIRVSVGTQEENNEFIRALKTVLKPQE